MSSKNQNNPATATETFGPILESLAFTRGMPKWPENLTAANVAEVIRENGGNLPAILAAWQNRDGLLGKLPASLLKESGIALVMGEGSEHAASVFGAVSAGQVAAGSGDAILDACVKAGQRAQHLRAVLRAALALVSDTVPDSIQRAGDDRIDAYTSARDTAVEVTDEIATAALDMLSGVMRAGTKLTQTYGTEWFRTEEHTG